MVVTKRRSWRTLTLVMVAAITLAACGSDDEESGGDDRKVAKIGVIVPLLAGSTAVGIGIRNSVDLAINQANDSQRHPRLAARAGGRGRRRQARHRRPGRQQAGVRQRGGGRDRHLQLERGPADDPDPRQRQHRPGLAGQHQRHPHPGRELRHQPRPAPQELLPHRHPRLAPGRVRGRLRLQRSRRTPQTVVIVHDGKTYGKGLAESFQARFIRQRRHRAGRGAGHRRGRHRLLERRHQHPAPQPRPHLLRRASTRPRPASPPSSRSRASPSPSWAATASSTRPTSTTPRTRPRATWAPRSAPPPSSCRRPRPTSTPTPRPATATRRSAYGRPGLRRRPTSIIDALVKVLPGKDEIDTDVRAADHRRHPGHQLRRRHRQGRLRPVRRHGHQAAHRLQGGRQHLEAACKTGEFAASPPAERRLD